MKYIGKTDEYFEVTYINAQNQGELTDVATTQLMFLWFDTDDNKITIDGRTYTFHTNQIICLTEFHRLQLHQINGLKLLKFNRPFYCIVHQDSEVGCKGILYFGSSNLPIIEPQPQDIRTLQTAWDMLCLEMQSSQDNLQLEMLQMMLQRILILCTRIYKAQTNFQYQDQDQADLVRNFNFLVEQHFREKHTVAAYAELLHKSPKTLSNLFKKTGNKTPLELIHNRKMIEARRLLRHSSQSISDIGFELGFNDIQTFSRFFKKQEGMTAKEFKEK